MTEKNYRPPLLACYKVDLASGGVLTPSEG
ncbi:MAG: hypothetical protein K0R31_3 [Clostridiales bacterium]|nr:hypothetical protein [Clostridiales bacterium]